jgi:predicted RNA methylase
MNIGQSRGLKRNTIDKYYTNNKAVELCLSLVKTHISIDNGDLIIEPSAGNGAFISGIKLLTDNFAFYDLEPDNMEITRQDYLAYMHKVSDKRVHVIGNPPFGRQSSLAIKFIKKSCEFCDSISFILPKSFKKNSLKHKFPLNFHLIVESEIPYKSFLVNNVEHDVPCVFQIWEKRPFNRVLVEKIEPLNFMFVKKTQSPDISVRRVGVNAGIISIDIDNKSVQSHYFIKFTNDKNIENNREQLSQITYDFNNTVGPKSISRQELIVKFNPILQQCWIGSENNFYTVG